MLRLSDHTPEGAMAPQGEAGVPATLSRWVREIVGAIPGPARSTVAELILGALLGGGGHVTQAVLALTPRLGWQAYHWMLERGRFRLLGLVAALCGIVRRETCGGPRRFAIIDDTLAPRCSTRAPGAAVRFDHARKPNRPAFLLCQAFVTLGTIIPCRDRPRCVPVVTGLCRGAGHAGKIALAKALLRAVTCASISCAPSQRARQKPSRPASNAMATRVTARPVLPASSRQRRSRRSSPSRSGSRFFSGCRLRPGTMPATSQLDWLSSITAISVLSCCRATRDLLRSSGRGMGQLRQVGSGAAGAPPRAAAP